MSTVLLYADESGFPAPGSPMQAQFEAYGAFFQEVDGRGQFQAGDPVQPSAAATTVTVRDGRTASDGPAEPRRRSRSSGSTCSRSPSADGAVALGGEEPRRRPWPRRGAPILVM